jgi:hypothetical protein
MIYDKATFPPGPLVNSACALLNAGSITNHSHIVQPLSIGPRFIGSEQELPRS